MNIEERVKHLNDLWLKQRSTLNIQQKDAIGYAYLEHIIGVDEPTALAFVLNGNSDHYIGLRQGGAKPRKEYYEAFWNEVEKITPDTYSQEDLDFLISTKDILGVFTFMTDIDPVTREESEVIRVINRNAHMYKYSA